MRRQSQIENHESRIARRGLTLYEVILAVAIFLPALAALGQGISTGLRAGVQARLQTQAVLRCDSILSEVVAGVRPLQPVAGAAFDDAAVGWSWSLDVLAGPHPHLFEVQVTAVHVDEGGLTNASYTVTRYVRDPQLFIDAAALKAAEEEARAATEAMP